MKKTALITGASNGIGLELARECGRHGLNVVLVARNWEKLQEVAQELAGKYDVHTTVIEADLSVPGAADEVYRKVSESGIIISYLVNNAGFGDFGMFSDSDWKRQEEMINLNILALTRLCHLFIPDMQKRKTGRIMNLASTAAFVPGPLMSVYYATKAYVLSFSMAIRNELKAHGITVTTLCPGATRSNFQEAANLHRSGLFVDRKLPSSEEVAKYGFRAMIRGTAIAVPGIRNKLDVFGSHLAPRSVLAGIVRMISEEKSES